MSTCPAPCIHVLVARRDFSWSIPVINSARLFHIVGQVSPLQGISDGSPQTAAWLLGDLLRLRISRLGFLIGSSDRIRALPF